MNLPTRNHRPVLLRLLAVLGGLILLALSACLPLQFGLEVRPTSSPPATRVALLTPTGTPPAGFSPTLSPTAGSTRDASRTPGSGLTTQPTVPAASATSTAPAPSATLPASETPRPPATAIECRLTHMVRQGERLTQIAELYGVRWQDIATLNGLENPGLIFAGQVLCLPPNARLPNTPTRTATPTPSATASATITPTPSLTPDPCQGQNAPAWFFTPAPPACPTAAAITSQAAAQRFEQGQMIWLGALDQYFVLFDGASASARTLLYLASPLDLKPGASPDNRVPETPPPGREQPLSGFGLIWRGEVVGTESARSLLGWATQSEFAFTTTCQCQASTTAEWNCYLRAPTGQILRFYFTPGLGYYWDNW
jgi:LysM repeat protein